MTFVQEILTRLPDLAKPQCSYLLSMFHALFVFIGKANRTNLSRHGAPSPRTQYRWGRRAFDFLAFNLEATRLAEVHEHEVIGVLDESFIEKSGKKTHGLGKFYDGCLGRARKGLAISLAALVDLDEHTAYALQADQIPPKREDQSRLDFAIDQYKRVRRRLPWEQMTWVCDGYYAKRPFVDAVCDKKDVMVGKLRKDAALRYLYRGPRRRGPGRPKKFDGKVIYSELARWKWVKDVEGLDENVQLLTEVLWHNSLKRELRVVMLRWMTKSGPKHLLLFSTETQMDPVEVYRLYQARFQIEFLFRDARQHVGLDDAQVREKASLHHHFNLSFSALNLLRIEELRRGEGVLSIASARRRKQNEDLMNRIFSTLDIDTTHPKIQPHLSDFRNYGVIAA